MRGIPWNHPLWRVGRRAAALLTLIAFCAAAAPSGALARDMMLDSGTEMSPGGLQATGWTFTALTLLSLGYAAYSYNVTQDELDKADENYEDYQNASTESDAVSSRSKVESHHDKAKSAETRTNIAIALSLIFAVTAFYSFSPDSAPNISVTATTRGPIFEWRF
jgi:hypothetical protein